MHDALRAARERLEDWFVTKWAIGAPIHTQDARGELDRVLNELHRRLDDVVQAARLHDASAPF